MGSIPLPALDIKPVQQQDPIEQYSRLLQLKQMQTNAPLQTQALQQQVQSGGLEVQQKQQQLKDQQAMTSAMQNWDGKDYNDLVPLVMKHGGSAQAVMGLKKSILDQQTQVATAAKDNAQAASDNITATMKKNDVITGALSPLLDPKQVPDEALPQTLTSTVQSLQQQGLLDPQHAQAAAQLAQSGDPNAMRQGIDQFSKTLMAHSQIVDAALKKAQTDRATAQASETRGKIDPASPFYAPSPASVAMGTAPGAAAIQQGEVQQAANKAGAEERARMPGEMALAAQRQALSQGDPNAAGQLLANHDATLSELKSRGATPDFIAKSLFAAKRINPSFNPQQDEAQFDVAKSPANVAFFGSAKSLTDKGGTLDQLAAAARDIPGNQIPVFNSVADVAKAATGSGPVAKYASLLLGVSDDYSKVMGGGQGSDSSRNQALHLVPANASPEARAAAIEGIRGAVGSQLNSRIGDNPVLKRMYGGAPAQGGGMITVQIPGSPPGQIPAGALDKFKADHPNAQVSQ